MDFLKLVVDLAHRVQVENTNSMIKVILTPTYAHHAILQVDAALGHICKIVGQHMPETVFLVQTVSIARLAMMEAAEILFHVLLANIYTSTLNHKRVSVQVAYMVNIRILLVHMVQNAAIIVNVP